MTARDFAIRAHGDQKYGEHPYIYHLDAVVAVLVEFGFGAIQDLMDAAYLHDAIEDCGITSYILWKAGFNRSFGLVYAVTNEPGKNRAVRHSKTYPKMAGWENATIVKLADRIANVRECLRNEDSKHLMYSCEYAEFYKALYREDHNLAKPVWDELDCLHSGPKIPIVRKRTTLSKESRSA